MLSQIIDHLGKNQAIIQILVVLLIILIFPSALWAMLSRSTHPTLSTKPKVPPMLPYRAPFIGHLFRFFSNSEELMSYGRSIHILTDPSHVAFVHSEILTFDFNAIFKEVMISFGMSRKGSDILFGQEGSPSRHTKSLFDNGREFLTWQSNGNNLRSLAQDAANFLLEKMTSETITAAQITSRGILCVSVKDWACEIINHAMQNTYFGPEMQKIDPFLPKTLTKFSFDSWQCWYNLPRFLRPKTYRLLEQMITTHERYLTSVPAEKQKVMASYSELFREDLEAALNSTAALRDRAVLMMITHWGICQNPADITSWLICHVAFEPNLMKTIREETAPAFKDGSLDTFYLITSCPVLESVWFEVLRFYASVTSMRKVNEDTQIGEVFIRKESMLMYSARQLALDESVFGKNCSEFDSMRFFKRPELQYSNSLRPFGGGKKMCPGRHLARHVASAFVAILLRRYNISLAFPQTFPRVLDNRPTIGTIPTKDELFLKLEAREQERSH